MTTSSRPPSTVATDPTVVEVPDPEATSLASNNQETRPTQLAIPQENANSAGGTHQAQVWGDFRFGALLGKGGMGAVYAGSQVSLDRPVAIKVLPPHLSGNESFRERFVIEARSVARINSPHVIQVYGAGVHEGHHFFAMELVDGQDLSKVLKTSGRPEHAQAAAWLLQAARGLAAAGELGIIHRDIKPANLMLTTKGVVKVMDFGLARLASEGQGLTMTGTIMGTVSYFSPEQGRGERCDCRTDIYALGITFYELLTGHLPFTGTEATSVIYQHIHVDPKPPRSLEATIPEDYQAVCLKCMQKSANDRYQTAADLIRDLEALLAKRPPNLPVGELQALRRGLAVTTLNCPTKNRRPWGLVGGAGLLAAAGLAGVIFALRPSAPAKPSPAPLPPPPLTVDTVAETPPVIAKPTPVIPPTTTTPPTAIPPAAPTPSPVAFDPRPLEILLDQARFADARSALTTARTAHPGDPALPTWAGLIDRAEGQFLLAQAREAQAKGDLVTAEARATAAAALLPQATEPTDLVADLKVRRQVVEQARNEAAAALARGAPAEAERRLTEALSAVPAHPSLIALLAQARAERERREELAQTQVVLGDAALERKDPDAALAAYATALDHVPGHPGATNGQTKAHLLRQQMTALQGRIEAALERQDATEAKTLVESLLVLAPSDPATRRAASRVADLQQTLESQRQAAERQEQQRQKAAAALAIRMEDRSVPVGTLAQELSTFIAEAGSNRPERPRLETLLEDRRQLASFEQTLVALDRAIMSRQAEAIATAVEDPDLRQGLQDLGRWSGLTLATTLVDFRRTGEQAQATVKLRHAFDVYPEQTLNYAADLTLRSGGWVITAARLQEPRP